MNTKNKGNIWHGYKWKTIFEYLPTKEHNEHKAWWIEKIEIYDPSAGLFSDKKICLGYQLKCEEGYKNKIPERFNEYIQKTFKDDRYITELKESEK